jgi:hypothetical protein
VDLTELLADVDNKRAIRQLERAHSKSLVEYEEKRKRRSLERRWLQEDSSYLEARVRELRRRTAQGRVQVMQKAEDLAVASASPVMRRTSGTMSSPCLPRLQESHRGAMTGGKQSAAVRSLKSLQRELKTSDSHADRSPASRADADTAMGLPFLEPQGVHTSMSSSLLRVLAAGVTLRG